MGEKKLCLLDNSDKYINFSFILGSAAEEERLWSTVRNLLSNNKMKMSLLISESLLFLKVNEKYWDVELESEAMKMSRSEKVPTAME